MTSLGSLCTVCLFYINTSETLPKNREKMGRKEGLSYFANEKWRHRSCPLSHQSLPEVHRNLLSLMPNPMLCQLKSGVEATSEHYDR